MKQIAYDYFDYNSSYVNVSYKWGSDVVITPASAGSGFQDVAAATWDWSNQGALQCVSGNVVIDFTSSDSSSGASYGVSFDGGSTWAYNGETGGGTYSIPANTYLRFIVVELNNAGTLFTQVEMTNIYLEVSFGDVYKTACAMSGH